VSTFNMRLNQTLSLLEAEDEPSKGKDDLGSVNRRGFIASAVSSVAGGPNLSNVFGSLGSTGLSELVRDEFGKIDFEYYSCTPVDVWLPTMSPAGIRAFKAEIPGDDYATHLAVLELKGGGLFDDHVSLSKSMDRIRLIGKHWNLKSSEILDALVNFEYAAPNELIERFGDVSGNLRYRDVLRYKNWKTVVNNLDNFFRQNASSMNVTIDAGHGAAVQRFANVTKLWERQNLQELRKLDDRRLEQRRQNKSRDEQREKERKEEQRRADKDYELDLVRWSGEGGASGPNESYIRKLSRVFD